MNYEKKYKKYKNKYLDLKKLQGGSNHETNYSASIYLVADGLGRSPNK